MSREWILETISCSYGRAESCVRIHFVVGQSHYNTSEFVPPRVTEAGVARSRIGPDNTRGVGGSCPWVNSITIGLTPYSCRS